MADVLRFTPKWMSKGSEFDDLWKMWRQRRITYLTFARRIQDVDDVPQKAKDSHLRSAAMFASEEEVQKLLDE